MAITPDCDNQDRLTAEGHDDWSPDCDLPDEERRGGESRDLNRYGCPICAPLVTAPDFAGLTPDVELVDEIPQPEPGHVADDPEEREEESVLPTEQTEHLPDYEVPADDQDADQPEVPNYVLAVAALRRSDDHDHGDAAEVSEIAQGTAYAILALADAQARANVLASAALLVELNRASAAVGVTPEQRPMISARLAEVLEQLGVRA